MGVLEIASVGDAAKRIERFFGAIPNVEDYAKLAWFLTQEGLVRESVTRVSEGIWDEYRRPEYEGTLNRFTRAIIRYAAASAGFRCQENVVFTGPLSSEDFLGYVADGVLWKDTFAPEHGEFSHTFQWLSAGLYNNWQGKTAQLYMDSMKYTSIVDLYTRNGRAITAGRQNLWAWLVDCFPANNHPSVKDKDDNILSDSCRTPNNMTRLIATLDPTFVFVTVYINYRQRVKIQKAEAAGMAPDVYERGRYDAPGPIPQESKRGIQAIKSYQSAHYATEKTFTWKGHGERETVRTENNTERGVHRVYSRSTELNRPWEKKLVPAKYHHKPGFIPEHIPVGISK